MTSRHPDLIFLTVDAVLKKSDPIPGGPKLVSTSGRPPTIIQLHP